MRLPTINGEESNIDTAAAEKMVDTAMAKGINYYDTAWGYHAGQSELFMGKALKKYPRESFYLASKFPGYDLSNFGKTAEIFHKQLQKCQVEYFDFYLFHNICELNIDAYLDNETYHTYDYLIEQKKNGRIRHLGFSIHGNLETLKRFLAAYGKDMEFCQVQLNYLDWDFQNAQAKVTLLQEYNIPIWVMEPLRGGKLVKLAPEDTKTLKTLRPEETIPGWAFRFVQSLPEVKMILSGMSNQQQLEENLQTFDQEKPLTPEEMNTLFAIGKKMTAKTALPCTACHYCTSHCPQELDIPYLLELYNEHCFTKDFAFIAPMALGALPAEKQPSACIGCGSCEVVCPQQIKIAAAMADFTHKLGN